jgi:hypothetical protein
MAEERHIHIHIELGDVPPGTHVHIHAPGDMPAADPEPGTPGGAEADPAASQLDRLKAYGHGASLQAIYDGLLELGYVPSAPAVRKPGKAPEPYLSWTDPVRGGPAVIRFDTKNLWFIRREDLRPLADSGGTLTQDDRRHNVHFTIGEDNTEAILDSARLIKH